MGNEQSQLPDFDINERATEVTEFWTHHAAIVSTDRIQRVSAGLLCRYSQLSIFIGEPNAASPVSNVIGSQTVLERSARHLKIYRHPSILHYISSWHRGSQYYLAVEYVKPLSHVLRDQSTIQICIGLCAVLQALVFLHERACVSHNNVATAAVYVTGDGNWKLSGLEYACSHKELNAEFLARVRQHRYEKSVDPDEDKHAQQFAAERPDAVDVYAFGVLCMEVLRQRNDDDQLHTAEYIELCKNDLLHSDMKMRPKLQSLLSHPFFNHEFIAIHSFLLELPLKSEKESTQFFTSLVRKLLVFDESIVARQLGKLLLSRMVLLNKTAHNFFIPFLFTIKENSDCQKGLFSEQSFTENIVPILHKVFRVRDAQIRLLLLEYFGNYMHCFTKESLQTHILPELLVGIKDTNDQLVAVTLQTLALLVPILGAETVIGGKRARLFNDGRPIGLQPLITLNPPSRPPRSRNPSSRRSSTNTVPTTMPAAAAAVAAPSNAGLPERPSPDGEEDEITDGAEEPVQFGTSASNDDDEHWDDWGGGDTAGAESDAAPPTAPYSDNLSLNNYVDFSDEPSLSVGEPQPSENNQTASDVVATTTTASPKETTSTAASIKSYKRPEIADIYELDIKMQCGASPKMIVSGDEEDFNFFQDMEPVIQTCSKYLIQTEDSCVGDKNIEKGIHASLSLSVNANDAVDGWDEEEWN